MTKVLIVLNMQESNRNETTEAIIPRIVKKLYGYNDFDSRIIFVKHEDSTGAYASNRKRDRKTADMVMSELMDAVQGVKARVDVMSTHMLASTALAELMRRDFMDDDVSFDICGAELETNVTATTLMLRSFVPNSRVCVNVRACGSAYRGVHTCNTVMRRCGVEVVP